MYILPPYSISMHPWLRMNATDDFINNALRRALKNVNLAKNSKWKPPSWISLASDPLLSNLALRPLYMARYVLKLTKSAFLLPIYILSITVYSMNTTDNFRDIPMDSQTTDITHFAVVFHYDITIKALETLRNTANYSWRHSEKNGKVRSLTCKIKV